jgi:amino acid adenylation domain-containing protein
MNTQNKNIESIYPLSPMQQGMLFHTLYTPNSGIYFEQLVCTLHSNLDAQAFHQAWLQVVERHQVLRSLFMWEHGKQPLQVVCKSVKLPWLNLDWQALSTLEQQQRLETFLESEREQGFKLDRAPLMRCTLIKVQPNTYQFIWSHHHLLMDGWCLSIILKEVLAFYEASIQGDKLYLAPPYPYKDYIAWLQKQEISQSQAFWQKILQGFTTPTPLMAADRVKNDSSHQGQAYAEKHLLLPPTLTKNLQALAQEQHLTLNILVQGAWALLLSRYSGESDILFGTTVSGRPSTLAGVESMVGLFINTLPVRVKVAPETQFLSWIKQLQAQLVELDQYHYSSLVDIQAWSDVPRGTPIFESLVVFENYPLDASLQEGNSSIKISNVHGFELTNYPLTVIATPGTELSVQVKYDPCRFDVGIINQILGNLQTLLEEMVIKPQASLWELQLLTQAEQHQLLIEWNHTSTDYPKASIHELFEAQVEKTPDAVAVVFEEQQLTYRELNARANQLANYLQILGVRPEVLVGICVERSLEMVVGLLGILKAGGAYVPLDPNYPQERLAYVLSDAQVTVLLTQQQLVMRLPVHEAVVVCLDREWEQIASQSQENLVSGVIAENLAYINYTSGSTGKPKGVEVLHRGVARLLFGVDYVCLDAEQRFLQMASISFDASTFEIWGALLHGGQCVLFTGNIPTSQHLKNVIQKHNITTLWLTSALFNSLIDEAPETLSGIKQLLIGGEALSVTHVKKALETLLSTQIINGYGPTESTTFTCCYPITRPLSNTMQSIPIGCPIGNTQVYLLDKQLQAVPIGVVGEVYIGGDGLARGYLNRSDLTKEKFIPNPFSNDRQARLYKSGDLARYLPNGNIEYLGRIDRQVKLRGFRIEIGEIEAAIYQHPEIREAVVIVREDRQDDKRLVGYVVSQSTDISALELRNLLKAKLPDYMIPSAFVVLEKFPLTANGKIDRRALPAPDTSSYIQDRCYQPPGTPTEEVVAAVWLEILGVEVGINVNFFEVGGHSLLATQVISRLQKAFAVELPLQYLFQYPTIAELSECIDRVRQAGKSLKLPAIEPVARTENLPLSFAQQRLWFLDQLEEGSSTYNVPAALELKGTLNPVALEQSLVAICQRHEALRTIFPIVNGYPVQVIASDLTITMPVIDLRHVPKDRQNIQVQHLAKEEAQQPFDLANGPLLRTTLLKLGEKSHVLVLVMHHIISDGWSLGVLVCELSALYQAFAKSEPSPLPELPIQYADFAHWQHQWLQGEVMKKNLSYWNEQLANLPTLKLPTDPSAPSSADFSRCKAKLTITTRPEWRN